MAEKMEHHQAELIHYLLQMQAYLPLETYIQDNFESKFAAVRPYLQLAQAILNVDIGRIEQLASTCNQQYLLKPTTIQQKVYFYSHYLNLQLRRQEYGDYFRGLTPVLVDVFRLLIENDFMPEINQYMTPVVKDTVDGKPLYRGLQWYQQKIEEKPNKVQETFDKYYGSRFNYDHYVSSTHLIKLIEDHSHKSKLKDLAMKLRYIEKYMRNIIAHEVITVDEDLIQTRVKMSMTDIHELYLETLVFAGLTDQRQWDAFEKLHEIIKQHLEIS